MYFYVTDKFSEYSFKNEFKQILISDNLTNYNIYELFASFLDREGLRLYGLKIGNDTTISDVILAYKKILYFKEATDHVLARSVSKSRKIAYDIKYGSDRIRDEKLIAIDSLGFWEDDFRDYCRINSIDYMKNRNVLEVGFGTGQIYKEGSLFEEIFGEKKGRKYITDISEDAISVAKKCFKGKNNSIIPWASRKIFLNCEAELLHPGISDNSIDIYLSFRTYSSSLFDIRRAVVEAKRVLRSGGTIIISIPHLYIKNDGSVEVGLMRDVRAGKITKSYRDEVVSEVIHYLNLFEFDDVTHSTGFTYETYISARRCIAR